jgi:peptidoglycan/LPS O-acetylase OafA/YrhL
MARSQGRRSGKTQKDVSNLRGALARRTTSGRFIPAIDGLRFVAIAIVVAFHLTAVLDHAGIRGGWLASLTRLGGHGVHVFFVISGFLLAVPFAAHGLLGERPVDLRRYILRRVTRLGPPYVLSLTATFVFLVAMGRGTFAGLLPHFVAGAAYAHNVVFGGYNPLNFVTWSLEIEIQFYIVMPLLALVFVIGRPWVRRAILVGGAVGAAAFQVAFVHRGALAGMSLVGYLQYFLMGLLLADLYLVAWRREPSRSAWWDGIWVIAWVASVVVLRQSG